MNPPGTPSALLGKEGDGLRSITMDMKACETIDGGVHRGVSK